MINQLRIYEIFDETKQAFLDRFREHAVRLMRQHGFRILAMWETRHNDNPAFAYLLGWQSEAEMAAAGSASWRTRSGRRSSAGRRRKPAALSAKSWIFR